MSSGERRIKKFPSVRPPEIMFCRQVTILPYAFVRTWYEAAKVPTMKCPMRQVVACSILLLACWPSVQAQLAPCYAGFEISAVCIAARGLDQKAAMYRRKIAEAMMKLGASYQIALRLVNHPVEAGYDPARIGDVFTDVVRNE